MLNPISMILSFADELTLQIWQGNPIRRLPDNLQRQTLKRLTYLNSAECIEELYQPPSNHFHALQGTPRYCIRVNKQWRLSFAWSGRGPEHVRLEDYH
jgi:proteic killer suppression protein